MALPSKLEWDEASRSWIPATGKAGASFVEWDGARWVEGKNPEGPGAFRRGLATGMEQIKGTVADLIPAMVQGAFGYEESSKKNLEEYKERMEALKARGLLAETDYRNVNNLSSALSFAGEAVGQSLPSLATSMLGGVGIGAGAARLGAGRLLSSQAAKKAAEYEAKGMAKDEALALAARETAQKVGTVAGAFGGSALLNVPESYQSLAEAGNASVGAAFVVGSLKSTLDALGPIRLLAKTRGTEFSDKLTDIVSARLLKGRPGAAGAVGGLLETAALEGVTEGTQQLLDETAAAILADKTIDWNSVINSALAGGVGAAPVGAGVGALGARRKAAEATAQAEAAEETKPQQQAARQKHGTGEQTERGKQRDGDGDPQSPARDAFPIEAEHHGHRWHGRQEVALVAKIGEKVENKKGDDPYPEQSLARRQIATVLPGREKNRDKGRRQESCVG